MTENKWLFEKNLVTEDDISLDEMEPVTQPGDIARLRKLGYSEERISCIDRSEAEVILMHRIHVDKNGTGRKKNKYLPDRRHNESLKTKEDAFWTEVNENLFNRALFEDIDSEQPDQYNIRYEDVIFLQGDEAEETIGIINRDGADAGLEHLTQWHYPGEHSTRDKLPGGTNDNVISDNGYFMYWNSSIPYVGLTYDSFTDERDIEDGALNDMKINEVDPFMLGKDRNVDTHRTGKPALTGSSDAYPLEDVQKDIKQNYSIYKTYRVRRLEPGFRVVKKVIGNDFVLDQNMIQKSTTGYQNFDDVTDLLNFHIEHDMSGSEQMTSSIGYSWYTLFNKDRSAGMIYYEDRGMGWDEIYLFANDKKTFLLIRDALRSYNFISTPKPRVKK